MNPLGLFFSDCSRQLFPFPFSPRRPGTLTWPLSSGTFLSASVSQTWQAPPSLWTRLRTVPVGLSCQRVTFGRFARGRPGGVGSGWFRFSPPVPCSAVADQHVVFLSLFCRVMSSSFYSPTPWPLTFGFDSQGVVVEIHPDKTEKITAQLIAYRSKDLYQRSNSASSAVKLFKTVKKHLSLLTQFTLK